MKHKLKMLLRELVARAVYHTPLWRLCDLLAPRRLVILAGHCVEAPSNDFLPPEMKIREETLEEILGWLNRRFEGVRVADGWRRLGEGGGKSLFALSMDDGYRDNVTHLLPLAERVGVPVTVYLESRPLDEQRVNWTHKFFWLVERLGVEELGIRYADETEVEPDNVRTHQVLAEGVEVVYRWKRALKYDFDPLERDRVIDSIFTAEGGDEAALCEELYMDADGVTALAEAGWELGGHTISHHVLSGLGEEAQREEVQGGRQVLMDRHGVGCESFAYPFGRRWDYNETSVEVARDAGFECAVQTHAGACTRTSDAFHLSRWMIDDEAALHLIAAEACGAFELFRRVGLDLSE
ncbi:MAG: polysaccharide deacetylase family protein [Planctomycetes bacterium]|nr:polysaccharide deacetylase family protein [Planctomycetota bacterium]